MPVLLPLNWRIPACCRLFVSSVDKEVQCLPDSVRQLDVVAALGDTADNEAIDLTPERPLQIAGSRDR